MRYFHEIRAKTARVLEHHRVPMHPSLPVLNPVHCRSADAVGRKVVALYCLAGLANGAASELMLEWLSSEGTPPVLDEVDTKLLQTRDLSEPLKNELSWKQESLYALCWSGALVEKINWPNQECDLEPVFHAMPPEIPIKDFLSTYKLREERQIVEALDLYYCLHASLTHPELWKESEGAGRPKIEVVMERRHALEWVCSNDVSWDEISLDT